MTKDEIKNTIERLQRQIVRARQLPPGAGDAQRRAAASVVADLEAILAEYREELSRTE